MAGLLDFLQSGMLENQLGGTLMNNDPMARAQMARQLEGMQMGYRAGQVDPSMMANVDSNMPLIGAMGPGPQGQMGLPAVQGPAATPDFSGLQKDLKGAQEASKITEPKMAMTKGHAVMPTPVGVIGGQQQQPAGMNFMQMLMQMAQGRYG